MQGTEEPRGKERGKTASPPLILHAALLFVVVYICCIVYICVCVWGAEREKREREEERAFFFFSFSRRFLFFLLSLTVRYNIQISHYIIRVPVVIITPNHPTTKAGNSKKKKKWARVWVSSYAVEKLTKIYRDFEIYIPAPPTLDRCQNPSDPGRDAFEKYVLNSRESLLLRV